MRLFIIFIFLTFVVLKNSNAAPQSNPIPTSVIDDKKLVNATGDDYLPTLERPIFKFQFGAIAGEFGDNKPENWNYIFSLVKSQELSFERKFLWGLSITSNQMFELKTQIDFGSLFFADAPWTAFGFGASHFITGKDGFSNLVNINQTKFVFYADLGPYFQIQTYYGLKGLAYSLTFQSWF